MASISFKLYDENIIEVFDDGQFRYKGALVCICLEVYEKLVRMLGEGKEIDNETQKPVHELHGFSFDTEKDGTIFEVLNNGDMIHRGKFISTGIEAFYALNDFLKQVEL